MKCLRCDEETKNPKYCSRSCAATANNLKPKRKRKSRCKLCDHLILSQQTYCPNCWETRKAWSVKTVGQVQAAVKYQGSSYIRSIARRIYRSSKRPQHCEVCGYDKHFEIHHKNPISSFPLTTKLSEVNRLDNLMGLCPNCHWEHENRSSIL